MGHHNARWLPVAPELTKSVQDEGKALSFLSLPSFLPSFLPSDLPSFCRTSPGPVVHMYYIQYML